MKKILITGSNGYLARNIAKNLSNHEVILTNRSNLDVCDPLAVDNFFKNNYFDVVFHTAIKGGTRLSPDLPEHVYTNCLMHFNILRNYKSYGKYISFGSGAELDRGSDLNDSSSYENAFPLDPYGMSKNIIAKTGDFCDKFFNIRIFNIFNFDELPTRMIKGNILRYINKQNLYIFDNKYMDFMYFDDFMKIINFYINNNNPPKYCNCSYEKKYTLQDIANIINNLGSYRVDIISEGNILKNSYIGKYDLYNLNLNFIGLERGIEICYTLLKRESK